MLKVTFTTPTAQNWIVCETLAHNEEGGWYLERIRSNTFNREMGGALALPGYYRLASVTTVPDEDLPEEYR